MAEPDIKRSHNLAMGLRMANWATHRRTDESLARPWDGESVCAFGGQFPAILKLRLPDNNMISPIRIAALWLTLSVVATLQAAASDAPKYWKFAAAPPMGWNSYDAWGTSVTETQVLENARWMQEHLLAHGWKYVVIDARWYDTVSSYDDRNLNGDRTGASLFADAFGRLLPATNRFPSAIDNRSFKPLADQIHAMGLKFGIHIMRGIPRESVNLRHSYPRQPLHGRRRGRPRK